MFCMHLGHFKICWKHARIPDIRIVLLPQLQHGKAEVTTEDAVSALRRAAKWAQMGLVVSTGSPVDMQQSDNSSSDKKKTAVEVICKDKNAELSRYQD